MQEQEMEMSQNSVAHGFCIHILIYNKQYRGYRNYTNYSLLSSTQN